MSVDGRVWPEADPGAAGLHARWYSANLAAGTCTAQRCAACRRFQHPARYRCTHCRSAMLRFESIDVRATMHEVSVTHRPFHPAFADVVPYATAVVRSADGPRMWLVVRCDPADVTSGSPVTIGLDRFGVPHAVLDRPGIQRLRR
ncbi:MAG: OB-fold domain-containing protein [Microthrixaceae bacterium]